MSRLPRLLLLSLLGALAMGCSTSSDAFVADQAGFAVTKGRILRIENLHSETVEPLADGVALRLSRPGCRVALLFPDGKRHVVSLPSGAIVVCAYPTDYVLRAEAGQPEDDTTRSEDPPAKQ